MSLPDSISSLISPNDGGNNRTAFLAAVVAIHGRYADADDGTPQTFNPYHAHMVARALVRYGTACHRYAETCCNREPTPAEQRTGERAQVRFEKLAKAAGFEPSVGGDPRGACAYILAPMAADDGDDWGGRGWGCYP